MRLRNSSDADVCRMTRQFCQISANGQESNFRSAWHLSKRCTQSSTILGDMRTNLQRFENHNVKEDIKALYKILDEVYRLYYSQKMARQKLSEQNVHDEQFEQSRNIAINIIDATNLWIENCLLYQDRLGEKYDAESFDLDYDLLVTMYIYGFLREHFPY